MNFELTSNEKYLLAIITSLAGKLIQKGIINNKEYREIIDSAQEIYRIKLSEEHKDYGV